MKNKLSRKSIFHKTTMTLRLALTFMATVIALMTTLALIMLILDKAGLNLHSRVYPVL